MTDSLSNKANDENSSFTNNKTKNTCEPQDNQKSLKETRRERHLKMMALKASRPPKRDIDGIFLLDKPKGMSSANALTKVRGIYRANKGGHTGSLDPEASGLLPICLGQAAKFSSYFLEGAKKYRATGKLGVVTSTGDVEGEIIETHEVTNQIDNLDEAISKFIGQITQVPPIYSAIKVDGKPLYKYARAGKTVDIPSREVNIFYIKLLDKTNDSFTVEVYCSKGTYIRTLIADIGLELGCGAHVTMLRRIEVDGLPKGTMYTLDYLKELADLRADPFDNTPLDALLIPIDKAMSYLPCINLTYEMGVTLCQGLRQSNLDLCTFDNCTKDYKDTLQIRVDGLFIGVGHIENGILIPDRMMSDPLHTNKGLYKEKI